MAVNVNSTCGLSCESAGVKPDDTEHCIQPQCSLSLSHESYSWSFSGFGPCSKSCAGGQHSFVIYYCWHSHNGLDYSVHAVDQTLSYYWPVEINLGNIITIITRSQTVARVAVRI